MALCSNAMSFAYEDQMCIKNLSRRQFSMLDPALVQTVSFPSQHFNHVEPDVINALNLVMGPSCKDEDIELVALMMKKASPVTRINFITSFTKGSRPQPWFGERFKKINMPIMPLVV